MTTTATTTTMTTLTFTLLLEHLLEHYGHTNDDIRLPVRFFKALLPADVWDDFLYSDGGQSLGRLRQLLALEL